MRDPSIVVLFTSYRCNASCVMCTAWRKQEKNLELSPKEITAIFSDRILRASVKVINITGGEPTLRDDLVQIVNILAQACTSLKRIDISTNGINTAEVIDKIEQILANLLETDIKLSVSISMDGIGDVHDKIRGSRGAFRGVDKTIDELKELMGLYPAFGLGLNATISRLNFNKLDEILNYSKKKNVGLNFTLAAMSDIGVESFPQRDNFELSKEEKNAVCRFIESLIRSRQMGYKYGNFMLYWLKTGRRNGKCSFREGSAMLCEPDGPVYRCGNFKEFKMGNVLNSSFTHIITSFNRNQFQKSYKIKCINCNSNCYNER